MKIMLRRSLAGIVGAALMAGVGAATAQEWVVGRWVAALEPADRPADALVFTPEGDAYNVWADGTRVPGMYIVTAEGVKAVFTYQGRDLITTFHADRARESLRIVISDSGVETVYRKTR